MAAHKMTTEQLFRWMCDERGVETPCRDCAGSGVKAYGSTSTWRGGPGGQMITSGTCNRCWGTGDENRRGTSFREIERWKAAYDRERAAKT